MALDAEIDGQEPNGSHIDTLLSRFSRGDSAARDALLALYYEELRRIAHRVVRGDGAVLHVQPTEILNEAAIRILKLQDVSWNDRAHFFAASARMMRQVLIDQVRRARSIKRAHDPATPTYCWFDHPSQSFDLEALDDALTRLQAVSEQKARIVELRFYGGLTMTEIAGVLDVSERTVEREWRAARAWLLAALLDEETPNAAR